MGCSVLDDPCGTCLAKGFLVNIAAPDKTLQAVVTIVFVAFSLSLGDAIVKLIGANFTLWQIFILRSLCALPIFGSLMHYFSIKFMPQQIGLLVVRSLCLVVMWIAYYIALQHVAFSLAAAMYYTLPLFIIFLAGMFLKEKIGFKGWIAGAIGFIGVLLVLRPETNGMNIYALLPIFAAFLFAIAMVMTRAKFQEAHPLQLGLMVHLAFIFVGIFMTLCMWCVPADQIEHFMGNDWAPMDGRAWGVMILLAVLMTIGSIGAAYAYQKGPAAIVGTFDFSYLGFAPIWGYLFFAETLDITSVFGIALIVSAGVLAIRR